jgi:hypothetical protein
MKTYGGSGDLLYIFKTSVLDESEWSASSPSYFSPRERAPDNHSLGDRVGGGLALLRTEISVVPTGNRTLIPLSSSP